MLWQRFTDEHLISIALKAMLPLFLSRKVLVALLPADRETSKSRWQRGARLSMALLELRTHTEFARHPKVHSQRVRFF